MHALWIPFLFALGACIGSFLNVVIYRLPAGKSIAFPGSHCPRCGEPIAWYDNIPLVSWLVLRGRCRHCKVRISPRYILIEALTALLVVGLYLAYYVFHLRAGAGTFVQTWPMFLAHGMLVCGLLACSAVDIDHWIVPLEVCWFVSLVGVVVAAAAPHPWLTGAPAAISPTVGAMSLAAVLGLAVSLVLQHYGVILPSFLDADGKGLAKDETKRQPDKPEGSNRSDRRAKARPSAKRRKGKKGKSRVNPDKPKDRPAPRAVATTTADGVNPRREILREVVFLAVPLALAAGAFVLVEYVPSVGNAWYAWHDQADGGAFALHARSFEAAVFGYLIGGLWVWGMRILGTLAFGKEAMGLGDVHIMAAVGAVTGWFVPTLAFFAAPFFGLLWAIYLALRRNQRELPYGPWLALGSLAVMILHDWIWSYLPF